MAKGGQETYEDGTCASLLTKISPKYIEDRVYLCYTPPPSSTSKGVFLRSEVEEWLNRVGEVQDDLIWLLELPYHTFWSYFAFEERVSAMLISYIQNAVRPYELEEYNAEFNDINSEKIIESQDKVHGLVLSVYMRLSNFGDTKETTNPLTPSEFGELIYDRFVFDIPTVYDICLVYGSSNNLEVSKIVDAIFTNQPLYLNDLNEAVICAAKSLKEIMQKSKDFVSVMDSWNTSPSKKGSISLTPLNDLLSYVLDVIFSVSSFMGFHSAACGIFLKYKFVSLISDIYCNSVPMLYCHIDEACQILFDGNADCAESRLFRKKLRILREEILKIYNFIVAHVVSESVKCKSDNDEHGVKKYISEFLDVWYDCLPFEIFVRDYNNLYPALKDFILIKEVCSSEVDHDKISFIMESVISYTVTDIKPSTKPVEVKDIESSSVSTVCGKEDIVKPTSISEMELQCRISSVSDILADVDVNIIRDYLMSMNYSVEEVIDAILKDSIAGIPLTDKRPSKPDNSYLQERLNVFDGDEFDIMTNDQIDMSRVHLGKKKDKYKDVAELMNDKSHRVEMAEMYQRLGIVSDTSSAGVDMYDDEYDDTYDENDTSCRRPFVTPRVLREVVLDSSEGSESEGVEEQADSEGLKPRDQFVANPAEVREKMEQRRMASRAMKGPVIDRDVTGKPKGQGQDHATQVNRQRKGANKSARANHQRKNRSLRKQQQGMF